jgi:hypothetical protein
VYDADGKRQDATVRTMDVGFSKGCEEMADQLSCDEAVRATG